MTKHVMLYGLVGAVLIAALRVVQYRYLMIENAVEMYGALVAIIFVALGIWLGLKITRKPETVVVQEVAIQALFAVYQPFAVNTAKLASLGITPREHEILGLIAAGLSNKEIAEKVFVSENTVKTHSRRLFEKLGARRRTQAVQLGKEFGILP